MTIYVDQYQRHESGLWCHMMADSDEELDAFAARVGLLRRWRHGDHYDLRPPKRIVAVKLGAVEVTSRDLVKLRISRREPCSPSTR